MPSALRLVGQSSRLVVVVGLVGFAAAWPRAQSETQSPTFRAGSDLIVVNVQVVDGKGVPVVGLTAKDFEVTIDGRQHRVAAVDAANDATAASGPSAAPSSAVPSASEPAPLLLTAPPSTPTAEPTPPPSVPRATAGRTFILAIDAGSFTNDATPGVIVAARQFVNGLSPHDEVALMTFPTGPRVDQTSDHVAITQALSGVSGERIGGSSRRYSPAEIVDFVGETNAPQAEGGPRNVVSASTNLSSVVGAVLQRECGGITDVNCTQRVEQDIAAEAGMQEQLGIRSLNQIRDVIMEAGRLPGRKFLVLVSAGLLAADRSGSHPDFGNLPEDVGHAAATANVTVYTLFIDPRFWERYSPETRKGEVLSVHRGRDSVLVERGLDLFTGAAGGAVFQDVLGSGELGFQRMLRETSAGYVLGVEPTDRDRDGDLHDVRVSVKKHGVTVRARQWVRVPKAGS